MGEMSWIFILFISFLLPLSPWNKDEWKRTSIRLDNWFHPPPGFSSYLDLLDHFIPTKSHIYNLCFYSFNPKCLILIHLIWVWGSFGLQQSQPVHPKRDQSFVFVGRTDAKDETPILWPPHAKSWLIGKDPDAGRNWGQVEKGRGWDGWMASPTPWTWVWVNSGSWWWTGRPGVLQSMGPQRVRHNWATELNWTELMVAPW